MALGDVIARLSVVLGMDTVAFEKGATQAEKQLARTSRNIERIGQSMAQAGKMLSLSLSAPLAAAGAGIIKTTGDFESGLNRIQIATEATASQMSRMGELALAIGKDTTFGASEAASAMELLAKAGIDTETILGGAAKAVTDLAAAAGSELDPAASAISDSINQFHLAAKDLPTIVNQITGAVNESKFDFADFTGGMAQAGGVASSAGLSFKDFAATLAATSSQFSSGSDAGTSLKTFLLALTPATKKAEEAMAKYGLTFFDAGGKMKPIGEIAQMLQEKFAKLDDQTRNAALKDIFGTDAIRTAVGLMNQGADGLDRISAKLAATSAADQAAKRMKGFNGQLEQLKGSLETLAIRIGQSGLLDVVTRLVTAASDLIDKWSQASPATLRLATVIGVVAAAVGPLLAGFGLIVQGLAPVIGAFSLLASSGGVVAAASSAFAVLGAALGPLLPVIAAVAGAGALIYANWDKVAPVVEQAWTMLQQALGPAVQALISAVSDLFTELWKGPLGPLLSTGIGLLAQLALAWQKTFGPTALAVLRGAVDAVTGVVRAITDGVRLVSAVFEGDWRTALIAGGRLADTVFLGLPSRIIGLMQRMVEGIRTRVVDKLNAVWRTVTEKVEMVKHAFFTLYDAVVGHSYVPDMVDGIAEQMRRLDTEMVDKAVSATAKTKQAFARLAEDLRPLLDRLFPEAAALNDLRHDRTVLEEGLKTGKLTPEQAAEAQHRRNLEGSNFNSLNDFLAGTEKPLADLGDTVQRELTKIGGGLDEAGQKALAMRESFQDSADGIVSALDRISSAFRGGGFLDKLGAILNFGLKLGSIGAFGKTISKNLNLAGITGAYANGTSFAPGGLALVGERGPELVHLPRGTAVTPNNKIRAGGDTYHFSGNLMTPEFWATIQAGNLQAARVGAQGGAALVRKRQSRRLA